MQRSSSTQLPPLPRAPRRDWVRVLCRVLCVVFAGIGLVPIGVGLLVRTPWVRRAVTAETRALLASFGVDASYELEVGLLPLSVSLRDVRVEASDGGAPVLTATKATAKPKLFGLIAGKLTIEQIEIDQPKVRAVVRDGKLLNLDLDLPDLPKSEGPTRPPFSVVSASDAEIDLTVDGAHVAAHEIDVDVTAEDDGRGGAAFELALRVGEARSRLERPPAEGGGDAAVDDDTLCQLDARVRIEEGRVLVRRLEAHGAADMDPAAGTHLGCDLPKEDHRYVEVALGQVSITLPSKEGEMPEVEGHVKARAPLPLVGRLGPSAPSTAGWVGVDAELRYTKTAPIPEVIGRLEVRDLRVERFRLASRITSELAIRDGVITSPLTELDIAGSATSIQDVEVRPLEKGIPIRIGRTQSKNADFTRLLRDFEVHPAPHVAWDLRDVVATDVKGTGDPLKLDGDLTGRTYDFGVYDKPAEDPSRGRIIGVRDAALSGRLAIRKHALEFHNTTVTTPKSVARGVLVSIGFDEKLLVEVPGGTIDLGEISPIGSVPMSGVAEPKVTVSGLMGDPLLVGDATIQDFVIGDIPFGNVTQGHVVAELGEGIVKLSDVRAHKGKSSYQMPLGRLDFNKPADMVLDGQVASKSLDLRDFLSMFQLDDDPRFEELGGTIETNARLHLALGGPEDRCGGGYLSVSATTTARDLLLFGERFDEGSADFEYRWIDRLAGVEGAEIDVRSVSLSKVKRQGRAQVGSVLGSAMIQRGGDLRGSFVVQGFPLARANLLGAAAAAFEGSASGVARVSGTLSDFTVEADVDMTPIRVFDAPFGGSDLSVLVTQKASEARPIGKTSCGAPIPAPFDKAAYLADTSSRGEIRASGTLFGGQVRVEDLAMTRQKAPVVTGKLSFDRFDLGPVGQILSRAESPAGGSSRLGGTVTGELLIGELPTADPGRARVRFSPKAFRVTHGGRSVELREGDRVFDLASGRIALPKMTFDLAAPNGFKGAFTLAGAVEDVARGGRLAVEAELMPIDLGVFAGVVPKVSRAVGTLTGKVSVTGKPSAPVLDGRMQVRGGELGIKGLPSGITDLEIDVSADENEVRVTRAVGRFLGGDVSAAARMPIKGGQLGVGQATVRGRQLYVTQVEGVRATVDADLEVTLNPNAPSAQGRLPFVGGDVLITHFDYTRPVTIDLTGFRGGAKRTVVEAYDPSADFVAFGVDIRSRSPLRIRNNLVDAQLAIDTRGIHVTGTNQRVGLRGDVATMPGGRFRVFANDFELQKGTIRFDDPTRIAPHVDVTAVTEYRRYSNTLSSPGAEGAGTISSGGRGGGLWRIALHAYGDAEDLQVDMTSEPALSREDIFFLLTIGLTRAEVDQVRADSVYASAAFEAIGTMSGADRAVKTAIPVIDDFRFGSAYSPRTGRTEPQVTLGRRLTDNVRANVSTGLTEDRQLRSNVEWRLSQPLSVQTSYDNISTVSSGSIGNFGLDFRWRIEFD